MTNQVPEIARRSNKAPIIGFFVLIFLAAGFFLFLSGNRVMEIDNGQKFTGNATVLSTSIKGKKCYLEIRRDDGVKELRANGYRDNCGRYQTGQKVHFTKGLIED